MTSMADEYDGQTMLIAGKTITLDCQQSSSRERNYSLVSFYREYLVTANLVKPFLAMCAKLRRRRIVLWRGNHDRHDVVKSRATLGLACQN